ncbi:MAG: hypothetical protein AAF558_13690 [Verrucomicrobiota bacterium]
MEADFLYRIYEPTGTPDPSKALPAFHWQIYSKLDGATTLIEIAVQLNIPEEACKVALKNLIDANAIRERRWTFQEFFPASDVTSSTTTSEGVAQDSTPIDTDKKYYLKDVLSFITSRSAGDMEGKLMVYRVFLQVPPPLLAAEGLTSLDFSKPEVEIHNADLRKAISQATSNIVGVPFDW